MENQILFGKEARNRVKVGLDKTVDAIKPTLGARGRNVMLLTQSGPSHITKDGVTVAQNIFLEDPIERAGSNLVKEAAIQTVRACGDGTTGTSIILQQIAKWGCKFLEEDGANVTEINRGIADGTKYVVDFIRKVRKPLEGNLPLLRQIATISANNDEALGDIISKTVHAAGENGRVSVVEAVNGETSFRVVEGMQYDRGLLAKEFITHPKRNLAVLEEPYILISERPLMQLKQVAPVANLVAKANQDNNENRPLLVIAPEVDLEALAVLVHNHSKGVLQICAVQCPGQGISMEDYTTDLAIYTGALVVSEERNIRLEDVTLADLGTAEKVEVGPSHTLVIRGGGDEDAIATRIEALKALANEAANERDKKAIEDRISSITCSVAILSVGAGSTSEMKEKIDRVDDAIKACRAANEEGYVPGGGATYNAACFEIPLTDIEIQALYLGDKRAEKITDYKRGLFCVYIAIQEIGKQIAINAGKSAQGKSGIAADRYRDSFGHGYDAKADEFCNLVGRGIIDPAKVLRVSLQNASSIASTFLTTEVVSFVK